jgi:hypothetical protein
MTPPATREEALAFEAHWALAAFRRSMRRLTLVWAAFLGGEAVLRAGLAAIWPNPTLVAATQILWIVLPILLTRWSIRAGDRVRRIWGTPRKEFYQEDQSLLLSAASATRPTATKS